MLIHCGSNCHQNCRRSCFKLSNIVPKWIPDFWQKRISTLCQKHAFVMGLGETAWDKYASRLPISVFWQQCLRCFPKKFLAFLVGSLWVPLRACSSHAPRLCFTPSAKKGKGSKNRAAIIIRITWHFIWFLLRCYWTCLIILCDFSWFGSSSSTADRSVTEFAAGAASNSQILSQNRAPDFWQMLSNTLSTNHL